MNWLKEWFQKDPEAVCMIGLILVMLMATLAMVVLVLAAVLP